jgi:hypothetical protein
MRTKVLMPALALIGAAVFMPTRPVSGDTSFFSFTAIGYRSCGRWTDDRRQGALDMDADEFWVSGFLSGVNFSRATDGKSGSLGSGTDQPGLYAWIDNYCQQHPLDDIAVATIELVYELDGHQW